jgi:hypothetical protein
LKTRKTAGYLEEHNIQVLVADKSDTAPEIDQLMVELGNEATAIPFYAIYPGDGRPPITFSDVPLTQEKLLNKLEEAISPAEAVSRGARTSAHVRF